MTTTRRTPQGAGSARPPGMPARSARAAAGAGARPAPAARAKSRDDAQGRGGQSDRPAGGAGRSPWTRWAILGGVLVILLVALVPTARSLLRQQGEIAALTERVAAQERTVADLESERARWQDPAYVEQQARQRLKFVKVGDRSYTVIDPDSPARAQVPGASVAAPGVRAGQPWYVELWSSVQIADQPAAGLVGSGALAPAQPSPSTSSVPVGPTVGAPAGPSSSGSVSAGASGTAR